MVHYHEQKKAYHLERAKHFQKMMGTPVVQMESPNDAPMTGSHEERGGLGAK